AVLQDDASEPALKKLAGRQVGVVPLEGQPGRYRFHRLFGDLLERELVEEEPHLIPALHRRAAEWYEKAGNASAALAHANAVGDVDRVAAIITSIAAPASNGWPTVD